MWDDVTWGCGRMTVGTIHNGGKAEQLWKQKGEKTRRRGWCDWEIGEKWSEGESSDVMHGRKQWDDNMCDTRNPRGKWCYCGSGRKWSRVTLWVTTTRGMGEKMMVMQVLGLQSGKVGILIQLKNIPGEKVVNVLWVYPASLNKCQETCHLVLNLMDTHSS